MQNLFIKIFHRRKRGIFLVGFKGKMWNWFKILKNINNFKILQKANFTVDNWKDMGYNNFRRQQAAAKMQKWRNWQTRTVQVRVVAIPWEFKSLLLHGRKSKRASFFVCCESPPPGRRHIFRYAECALPDFCGLAVLLWGAWRFHRKCSFFITQKAS